MLNVQAQPAPSGPAPLNKPAVSAPGLPAPPPIRPPALRDGAMDSMTNMPFKSIAPGVFELGKVRLDQKTRSVSFPATLNRGDVPLEYFLVTEYGKLHESLLRTETMPYHIHIAMLLLGAQGAGSNGLGGGEPNLGPIRNPSKERVPGDKVSVRVSWQQDGKPLERRAEQLLFSELTHAAPESAAWAYNGSIVSNGRFLAQMDGSIVSLVTDPVAMINNNAAGHDNDQIWRANTNSLPPAGLTVWVTLKLEDAAVVGARSSSSAPRP